MTLKLAQDPSGFLSIGRSGVAQQRIKNPAKLPIPVFRELRDHLSEMPTIQTSELLLVDGAPSVL